MQFIIFSTLSLALALPATFSPTLLTAIDPTASSTNHGSSPAHQAVVPATSLPPSTGQAPFNASSIPDHESTSSPTEATVPVSLGGTTTLPESIPLEQESHTSVQKASAVEASQSPVQKGEKPSEMESK